MKAGPVTYDECRDLIFSGDLIAVRRRNGFLPALTRQITGSPYTHTATALWLDDGLYVAEMDGIKGVLVPLSQYAGVDYDIFECPVFDRDRVKACTLGLLRTKIHYDYLDLARIAAWKVMRLPLPRQDRNGLVCSAFSARIYREAGAWFPGLSAIPAPSDLVEAVGTPAVLEVRQ